MNVVENWWFTHNAPTGTTPAPGSLPAVSGTDAWGRDGRGAATAAAAVDRRRATARRGVWAPSVQKVASAPVNYTRYFRPDPAYPSEIVGAAWLDQSLTSTRLIAGTREPGGPSPDGAQVPPRLRPTLVAAFNSGWKMKDIAGGFYADGRTVVPLLDGSASMVIDTVDRRHRAGVGRPSVSVASRRRERAG